MGHIPLIDIGPFRLGNAAERKAVAKAVDEACRGTGFLVITGHGVSTDLVKEMYRVSHEYFSCPLWEKMRFKMPPDRYRGYTPYASENLSYSLDEISPPDMKESFSIGPFDHKYDEYHFGPNGARYFAPNFWPHSPPDMRAIWELYYAEMEKLSRTLMQLFAESLDLPTEWFDDKIDHHITNFSVIHYPGQRELAVRPGQLRAGAHSDYGSLTIVQTDTDVGGLEVQNDDGTWDLVPWIADAFVINLGDLMAEWTNDRWVSTMHRVVNPPPDKVHLSKTSMLFFHQPNYDAVVECIPTCVSTSNPAKYGKTTSGEHVTMKVTKHRTVTD